MAVTDSNDPCLPCLIMVLAFALCCIQATTSSLECHALADHYLSQHHREASPYTGNNLVYFLHVPRTAGRTFHTCFLKLGVPPQRRCPKAYDHLRLNVSVPNCYLLSSHDDFSVVSMLPEDVSVVTQLRDPVDRVLSAYEFAVEVGSRFLNRPANYKKRANKIATEDVWPWSYLVPFFAEDIQQRMAKIRAQPMPETGNWIFVKHPDGDEFYYNKVLNLSKWNLTAEEAQLLLPEIDPYDNPMVMPLREFLEHPLATEVLHNGATFQVLGITNYSHWADAGEMRQCTWESQQVRSQLLQVAKNRIQRFIHVGATDKLADSVTAAAVSMQFSLDGPAYGGGEDETAAVPGIKAAVVGPTAVDLPKLAQQVREARLQLQSAQKELFNAHQEGQGEERLGPIKDRVNQRRSQLREKQEALVAARATLPTGTPDASVAIEAGVQVAQPDRRLPNALGVEFQRCAQRAQARNGQRREASLSNLMMPDGRAASFSKTARAALPQDVIDLIRRKNAMDTELHQAALNILATRRAGWLQEGRLQQLPPSQPINVNPLRRPPFRIPKPGGTQKLEAGQDTQNDEL